MERYAELKTKIVSSSTEDSTDEKDEATLAQLILDFNNILNTSDNAVSAARDDLSILLPLFSKCVLSKNTRIRQASILVLAYLQKMFTQNPQMKEFDWWKEYKTSFEQNCKKLSELQHNGCAEWPSIWCTLSRLLGDEMHTSVPLTNALCKIVEKSFKDKTDNKEREIQNGFNCWKIIVDNFTMPKVAMTKRRADFLLTPFKSPTIHSSKLVCEAKLQAWLHLLSKMTGREEAYIGNVLTPLVDFMFVGSKASPAAIKFIPASRCADEFISILKMSNVFKLQASLLIAATATCMETVKDNQQLSQIVWMTALEAIKKHIDDIGIDNPKVDTLLSELISVIDKFASSLSSAEFAEVLSMCIHGKCKLLYLKAKFQALIEITMKPKNLTKLQNCMYNVIQAILRLYVPKERTEKIFSVALDAITFAAANTENNGQITSFHNVLGEAWRAIVDSLIESINWIDLTAQFLCPYFSFPIGKNGVKCDSKILSSWKNLLNACMKTSETNKKNITNELIKHLASLDTESYSTSLEVMNIISGVCDSFDAIPYYSEVMDGLLKNSNSDSLNPIIQPLFESMLKYAKKNNKDASKLLEIANQLSNSKHDVASSSVRKNLSKFLNNMSMIENTTPEKSSKFLHRLAKAKEIQSQNNNRSPSSSPVGLFHLNSIEKKKSSPSVKTTRRTIDEESSQEFVMVPPKPKKTVLTNHQKEKLSTRRCDIPALYQDLSQDTMSMDSILNAGAVKQEGSNQAVKNELIDKEEVIQSLCEDAVGFDFSKPATSNENATIDGKDQNEDEDVIEDTQVLEKQAENKLDLHSNKDHQDDNTEKASSPIQSPNNDAIRHTDEVGKQKSDGGTSVAVSEVVSESEKVKESADIIQNIDDTITLLTSQKMETDDHVATRTEPTNDEVELVENPKPNSESNTVDVKYIDTSPLRRRKSATPLRKSVRKNKNKVSPNKIQLLGKRRSLTTTNSTKSPASSKRMKLQSRKSIAVVQSHSNDNSETVSNVQESCDNAETSDSKNSLIKDEPKILEQSCDKIGISKETLEKDDKSTEANSSAKKGGKSVSKPRKRALESTPSSEINTFEEKSPTLKKRLRKSLGVRNNPNSPAALKKGVPTKISKSKIDSLDLKAEEIGVDNSENLSTETRERKLIELTPRKNEYESSTVPLEKSKEDLVPNSENVSGQNVSSTESNATADKQTRKVPDKPTNSIDVTPKRQRLTPRINSKKKSPCACCSDESGVSSRVKRKDSLSRTLFEQGTPSRKNKRNSEESTNKDVAKETSNSVLMELNYSQASPDNNKLLPPIKNDVLQSIESVKKPWVDIGSPILNDSEIIDIHISEKEKMEFENCTLIEDDAGKENQESNQAHKKSNTDEPDSEETSDLKTKLCYVISSPTLPVSENNEVLSNEEVGEDVTENNSSLNQKLVEGNDAKNSTEVQRSKNKHKGLDSWVIRSPRVDRNQERHDESVTEENPELNESNLSKHVETQGVSDSDESFVVSSQQPSDSVIKIKRQSNSIVTKEVVEVPSSNEKDVPEKCIPSEENSKQLLETECDRESNTETDKKSESFSKSHVCRRLLDNLQKNKEENGISDDNHKEDENECDISFINDDVYCQVISQEVTNVNEITEVTSHISTDHDYVSPSRNQNGKIQKSAPKVEVLSTNEEVNICQSSNKSMNKTDAPDVSSKIDVEATASKSSKEALEKVDVLPNKANDTGSSTSKSNCKDEKTAKLSSPDRSKLLLSPSRATRIKRMVLESAKESPTKNEISESPMTEAKVEIGNNISSTEEEMNEDEHHKVATPPTAFKNKQSTSPDQSSSISKQRSSSKGSTSPSRALKIKLLIQNGTSGNESLTVLCSSPKKAAAPTEIPTEINLSSPPRTSRIEKQSSDSIIRSPDKSANLDVQEKNGIEGNSSVASSPQSARGRTAQLMGLVNGDSPAQFRRHQHTPKRIRPIRIITAPDNESHEAEDWVCRTYSPSAVPSPSILKTRLRTTDDVSPQSSPSGPRTKLSDDPSEISPPAKKKRVNFHDPPLTQKLFFFKTGSGKVVSQGKITEPDLKMSTEGIVKDVFATPVALVESSGSSITVINDTKQTHSDSSVDTVPDLPCSSASLKTVWNNVDAKEKLEFISLIISEDKELLSNVSNDVRKQLINVLCSDPEFVSLISKQNHVTQCITQDTEALRCLFYELDEDSQYKLLKNIDESVKMKLLGDISPETKVSILSDNLCTNPKLLKEVYKKIKVEDVARDVASQLDTNSELGKLILEKADFDAVAHLMITGINILKTKHNEDRS